MQNFLVPKAVQLVFYKNTRIILTHNSKSPLPGRIPLESGTEAEAGETPERRRSVLLLDSYIGAIKLRHLPSDGEGRLQSGLDITCLVVVIAFPLRCML
jgi:hypothetical protein